MDLESKEFGMRKWMCGMVTTTTTTMFLATATVTAIVSVERKKEIERRIEFGTKRIMVILSGILRPWVFLQSMNTHRRVFPMWVCLCVYVYVYVSSHIWICAQETLKLRTIALFLRQLRSRLDFEISKQILIKWNLIFPKKKCVNRHSDKAGNALSDWTCVVTINILKNGVEKGLWARKREKELC